MGTWERGPIYLYQSGLPFIKDFFGADLLRTYLHTVAMRCFLGAAEILLMYEVHILYQLRYHLEQHRLAKVTTTGICICKSWKELRAA